MPPGLWQCLERKSHFSQMLLGLESVLMVDPATSKEAVTHHVLSEQIDDRNQDRYEKNPYDSKPRRPFFRSTRRIQIFVHLELPFLLFKRLTKDRTDPHAVLSPLTPRTSRSFDGQEVRVWMSPLPATDREEPHSAATCQRKCALCTGYSRACGTGS